MGDEGVAAGDVTLDLPAFSLAWRTRRSRCCPVWSTPNAIRTRVAGTTGRPVDSVVSKPVSNPSKLERMQSS